MKKIVLIFAAMLAMAQVCAAADGATQADGEESESTYKTPFDNDENSTKHWSVTTSGFYMGLGVKHNWDLVNNSFEVGLLNVAAVNYNSLHGQNVSLGVGVHHRSYSIKRPHMLMRNDLGEVIARIRLLGNSGTRVIKVIHEGENLSLGDDVVLVIIVTDGKVDRGRTVDFQRAGPVVITFRTETESGNTQLGVDVITTNPQSGAEHGARVAGLGQMVLSDTAVVPHVAVAIDKGTDVVDVQLSGTLCTLTCSSLGLNSSVSRVGFLALDALACRDCRRESDE